MSLHVNYNYLPPFGKGWIIRSPHKRTMKQNQRLSLAMNLVVHFQTVDRGIFALRLRFLSGSNLTGEYTQN